MGDIRSMLHNHGPIAGTNYGCTSYSEEDVMNARKAIRILTLISLLATGKLTPAAASFNPPFTEVTGAGNPGDPI
jgi:hypothetical protein